MTDCKQCGISLVGEVPIAYEDGPLDVGDPIPTRNDTDLYDEEVGYIDCPGCDREIPITPRQFRELPRVL